MDLRALAGLYHISFELSLQLFELSLCVAHLCVLSCVRICSSSCSAWTHDRSALFSGYVAGGSRSGGPLHLSSFLHLKAATWFSRVHNNAIVSCHPVALSSFGYSFFVDSALFSSTRYCLFSSSLDSLLPSHVRYSAFCLHVSGDDPIRLLVVVVVDVSSVVDFSSSLLSPRLTGALTIFVEVTGTRPFAQIASRGRKQETCGSDYKSSTVISDCKSCD